MKVELGKTYLNKQKQKVKITSVKDNIFYSVDTDGLHYNEDGICTAYSDWTSMYDLIEEIHTIVVDFLYEDDLNKNQRTYTAEMKFGVFATYSKDILETTEYYVDIENTIKNNLIRELSKNIYPKDMETIFELLNYLKSKNNSNEHIEYIIKLENFISKNDSNLVAGRAISKQQL